MLNSTFSKSPVSHFLLLSFSLFSLSSCSNVERESQKKQFTSFADSLTLITQKHLVSNLSQAIISEGAISAVSFCNEKAEILTNEMVQENDMYTIQRKAERFRNPLNKLDTEYDSTVWDDWKLAKSKGLPLKTVTYTTSDSYLFYKPILLGMTTCLQCHGNKDEISEEISEKLAQLYPNDKAINFKLNELRGFWKVTKKLK